MNLFVTLIFAVCCGIAEFSPPVAIEHWVGRALLILIVTMIAPLTAVAQTRRVASRLIQSRESRNVQDTIMSRLSRTHSLVWGATGLLIFLLLDWPSVIGKWESLANVPVVYEIALLSPLMLSLIGSWLAFFDIQQFYVRPGRWTFSWTKRWSFAWNRVRMHLGVVLVPLVLLLTAMRLSHLLQQFSVPQIVVGGALVGLWISAMLPYLLMLFLDTRKFSDQAQVRHLQDICLEAGIRVENIRVWVTGNQIANAAVAGFLPGFRIVLLTDTLIKYFTTDEIAAIVRHEAGHIKLLHLPLKVLFIMLPMAALMLDQTHSLGLHHFLQSTLGGDRIFDISVVGISQGIVASLFVVYLFVVLRWLNHQLEHEADLFAALALQKNGSAGANEATRSALEKLAVIAPGQLNRATFMHPSIAKRVSLVEAVDSDPNMAVEFNRSQRRRKGMILLPWIALLALAIFS